MQIPNDCAMVGGAATVLRAVPIVPIPVPNEGLQKVR
jgi:hypothetical protein